jgi:hypothetical protein
MINKPGTGFGSEKVAGALFSLPVGLTVVGVTGPSCVVLVAGILNSELGGFCTTGAFENCPFGLIGVNMILCLPGLPGSELNCGRTLMVAFFCTRVVFGVPLELNDGGRLYTEAAVLPPSGEASSL